MITAEIAKELFDYDLEKGKLYWKKIIPVQHCSSQRSANQLSAQVGGKEACNVNKTTGYFQVVFDKRLYQVHRILWLIYTGEWPKNQIDHIDRNRTNNAISNLRDVPQNENAINRPMGATGHRNIYFDSKKSKPWRVMIKANKVLLKQQRFATLQEAINHRDLLRQAHGLPHIR